MQKKPDIQGRCYGSLRRKTYGIKPGTLPRVPSVGLLLFSSTRTQSLHHPNYLSKLAHTITKTVFFEGRYALQNTGPRLQQVVELPTRASCKIPQRSWYTHREMVVRVIFTAHNVPAPKFSVLKRCRIMGIDQLTFVQSYRQLGRQGILSLCVY